MTLGETPRLFRTTSRCRGYAVSRRARPLTYKRKLRPHRRHRRQRRPDRQRRAAPTHGRRPGGAVSPPLRRPRDGRAGRTRVRPRPLLRRSPPRAQARRGAGGVDLRPAPGHAVAVITKVYEDFVGLYWPPERYLVEAGYRTIPFPFEEIQPPAFAIELPWSLDDGLPRHMERHATVHERARRKSRRSNRRRTDLGRCRRQGVTINTP